MFIITKLLSFLPMGNMLRGTSGKIILVIGIVAGLGFLLWQWKDNIREAVYSEIFAEQAQAAIEDQQRQLETIQEIANQNRQLQRELEERNRRLTKVFDEAERQVRNASEEDDGEVSRVLRDTLRFIQTEDLSTFDQEKPSSDSDNSNQSDAPKTDNPWIKKWRQRVEEQD